MSIRGMVWSDMESTGLHETAHLLEVAAVITDPWGSVWEKFEAVIKPVPDEQLRELIDTMHASPPGSGARIVYEMHASSGLWGEVLDHGRDRAEVDGDLVAWLAKHAEQYGLKFGSMPLCGNSVWADHAWMRVSLPATNELFGHRNIDVSSTKELVKLRNPEVAEAWVEATADSTKPHRAMDDILHSIREFQFYTDQGVLG